MNYVVPLLPLEVNKTQAKTPMDDLFAPRKLRWKKANIRKTVFRGIDINHDNIRMDWNKLDKFFFKSKSRKRRPWKKCTKGAPTVRFINEFVEMKRFRTIIATFQDVKSVCNYYPEEIRNIILTMDLSVNDKIIDKIDFVEKLSIIVPNEMEREKFNTTLKELQDDNPRDDTYKEPWSHLREFYSLERFWFYFRYTPRISMRCKLWLSKMKFDGLYNKCIQDINMLKKIYDTIYENDNMMRIFQLVLCIGNFLNYGHKRNGEAKGVKLDVFKKMSCIKSKQGNKTYTLLMFLVHTVDKNYPELMNWIEIFDICQTFKSMEFDLEDLKNRIENIDKLVNNFRRQLEKIRIETEEYKPKEKIPNPKYNWWLQQYPYPEQGDQFETHMNTFMDYAIECDGQLNSEYKEIVTKCERLITSFGEKTKAMSFVELMDVLIEIPELWRQAKCELYWNTYLFDGYIRQSEKELKKSIPIDVIRLMRLYFVEND